MTDGDPERFERLFLAALARVDADVAASESEGLRLKAGYDYAQGLELHTDDESVIVSMSKTIRCARGLPY